MSGDELLEEILANAGDSWDIDAAAESIAVDYVRHLEAEVARVGGCPRREPYGGDGEPWPDPAEAIRAAERERIRRLADSVSARYVPDCLPGHCGPACGQANPFSYLLREQP